jgi:hypothetical protein
VNGVPSRPQAPIVLGVDAHGLAPTEQTLDGLLRLQLRARRLGASVELRNASPGLVDLLRFTGLTEVLPVAPESGLDPERKVEEGKETRVDEEVDARDPAP